MGIIRDVLDTIKDISSIGSVEDFFKKRKYSSIAKRSLEGTLQFPVLASRSLDIDTLQMITKAQERQFSTFVQISMSMSPALDIAKDKDAIGYLKRFHQNADVKTDLKDVFGYANQMLENYNVYPSEDGSVVLYASVCEGSTGAVLAANKEQIQGVLEHVRQDVLNNKFTPASNRYRFTNENLNAHYNRPVMEAESNGTVVKPKAMTFIGGDSATTNNNTYDIGKVDALHIDARGGKGGKGAEKNLPDNILKDNDSRKANELVPTTMHIRAKLFNDGEEQGFIDFIIGVKATLHPIASQEMVTNVVNACRNNNKFFNLLRWTSGEINFFKDFVLGLKEIKSDVVERSSGSSPWWIALKRRRKLAKMKDNVMMPSQILPNASIVMSMEEVEFVKSQYGFDLMNPTFVDKIMQEYFLISFVIVDNSSQIAHFLFDGQSNFQTVTFGALEKENTNKADMRETLKIINRANMV